MSRNTGARSDPGRVREGNEDRYLVREERGTALLAVADGVGGASGGEIAADAALNELGDRFFLSRAGATVADGLASAVREANVAVLSAAGSSGHRDAASTLVAAVIERDQAVIANLGDSRAYLVREGEIRQLTEDHAGIVRNAITRFVGDPRGVQPDVFVETLRPGDRLLLCSDGLTRHVTEEEIAATVRTRDVQTAANALVDLANARGGEDNITVIIHAAAPRALMLRPSGRVLALGIFVALVALVLVGSVAALLTAGSAAPSAVPIVTPSPEPTPSPSPAPSPSPTASPSETPSPSPTATP